MNTLPLNAAQRRQIMEGMAAKFAEMRRRQAKAEMSQRGYRDENSQWQGGLLAFIRYFWPVLEPGNPFVDGWPLWAICLPYQSRIITEDGVKPIGDIVEGRWRGNVMSLNHATGESEWRPVAAHMKSPGQALLTIKVGDSTLELTANHPVFTRERGYVRADEIEKGDTVFLCPLQERICGPVGEPLLRSSMLFGQQIKAGERRKHPRLQVLWRRFLSAALTPNWRVLFEEVFRPIQNRSIQHHVPMRRAQKLGWGILPGLSQQSPADWLRLCLRRMWRGDLSVASAICSGIEKIWRVLQSKMHGEPHPRRGQSTVRRWSTGEPIPARVLGGSTFRFEEGEEVLLPVSEEGAAGHSSHRQRSAEQRNMESGGAMPRVPLRPARSPHTKPRQGWSPEAGFATVDSVERAEWIPDAVYNIEVEGNNNYFAEGILVHNCEHLEAVTFGEIQNLLINVSPGFMKSLVTDVFWPAWEWGPMEMPHLRYVAFSYSSSLTQRDNGKFRDLMLSPDYQAMFCRPEHGDIKSKRFSLRKTGEERVTNSKHGFKLATSIGGVGTGERGDRIILDDPHNVKESESETVRTETTRWFRESMTSRLNNMQTGNKIVIMQRVHEGDISGTILDLGMDYVHLCYDDQTEILTRAGWLKFSELPEGLEVLGVDPATLSAKWEMPTRYVKERHTGRMISYKSATADMLVTPDHRMVYADSNDMQRGDSSRWRVRPAKDLPRDFYLPQVINWKGYGVDESIHFGGAVWRAIDLAEFLGWYLSEGCSNAKTCRTRIIQNRNGPHVPELCRVMSVVPFPKKNRTRHNDRTDCWAVGSKALAAELAPLGDSLSKRAPAVLDSMGPECLQAFIRAYGLGDGTITGKKRTGISISTASRQMADDLQRLAIKAGWSTTLNKYFVKGGRVFNGYLLRGRWMFQLTVRRSKVIGRYRKIGSKISTWNISDQAYDGFVYCVSVPSTAVLVRRNGRAAVSGNCIPMEYVWQADENNEPYATSIGWVDPRWTPDPEDSQGELAWPERWPAQTCVKLKKDLGEHAYAGQYQQTPEPRGGGIFKRAHWQPWEAPDGKFPAFSYVVASLDSAYTEDQENDPSALTVWGVFHPQPNYNRVMLVHAWQRWLEIQGPKLMQEPNEGVMAFRNRSQKEWGLIEWVHHTCNFYKVDRLLIEGKASGISVAQMLRKVYQRQRWSIIVTPVKGDKVARAYSVQPSFSQEMVYYPHSQPLRKWVDMTINQMALFPRAKHDDLTDSACQAIKHLRDIGLLTEDDEVMAQLEEDVTQDGGRRNKPLTSLYPC